MQAEEADWPAGRWRSRWIWAGPTALHPVGTEGSLLDASAATRFVCFRRRFHLDEVPTRAPCRVTADARYVLWMNGEEVSRGPVRAHPSALRADEVDLAPHLVEGTNVLAVLARYYGGPVAWWRPASPTWGLGAGCLTLEARVGYDRIVTDASWRALVPPGLGTHKGPGLFGFPAEVVDARSTPPDWTSRSFDDGNWESAQEIAAHHIGFPGHHQPPTYPYGPLPLRPILPLGVTLREPVGLRLLAAEGAAPDDDPVAQARADESTIDPATSARPLEGFPVVLDGSARVHLVHADFGQVVAGTIGIQVDAESGAQLDVMAAEATDATDESGALDPGAQRSGFRYIARGEDDTYETFETMGIRHLALSVRSEAPVTVRRLVVHERLHPRPPGPYFECSDPVLDTIWRVGRRTVDLCSHDAYLDCPTREQRAWTGDAVVHQAVDLASNPAWDLARWHPRLAAASARPDGMIPMAVAGEFELGDATVIPDWSLHWVRMVRNLWQYTGDADLVGELLPAVERVCRWFIPYRDDRGLLVDVTGWVLIDWAAVTTDGAGSALNGLWGRALMDLAEMAEGLGDGGRARWAQARHAELARGFDAFWDEDRGCYLDSLPTGGTVDGSARRAVSQHGNAAALVGGMVPEARVERVLDVLTDTDRLAHVTWLSPGRTDPGEGDLYDDPLYLFAGPPEPWWDVERQVVAAQPFFRYLVHDAIAEHGRPDAIPGLCRDWTRLLTRCDTSWSETWNGGSYAHAWSSTPTRDLLVRTLGVRPAEPGFARALVEPRLGDLEWARGAVPTPAGLLSVEVDGARVKVESPVPVIVDLGPGRRTEHEAGAVTVNR